jgi:glutamyl-tRNA synthetase
LFNWLFARHEGGKFVLRIEDTDRKRSTPESVQAILDGLKWLQIDWDEGPNVGGKFGPYFQTERMARYKEVCEQLIAQKHAYRCYCTPEELDAKRKAHGEGWKYDRTCRDRKDVPATTPVVRFAMPLTSGTLSFNDKVLGPISKTYDDLDDFVLMRRDGVPLYNFGCVVDDHDMEISLVGRGQEHINSTLPQLALYQALGWQPPEFAHMPLIMHTSGEKLSKRKHDEADVMIHRKNGILAHALVNYVLRVGWSHGNDELFTREQMVQLFDFAHVGASNAKWDPVKLLATNAHWMKTLPLETIVAESKPFFDGQFIDASDLEKLQNVVRVMRERAQTLLELAQKSKMFYGRGVIVDQAAKAKHLSPDGVAALTKARVLLGEMKAWESAPLEAVVETVAAELPLVKNKPPKGLVAQAIRVAVTGNAQSPGIGDTLFLIGRDESLSRIDEALKG